MTKNEFIKTMAEACGTQMADAGLLTSVAIAQSILETGWGTSELFIKANNCHGLNNYDDEVTRIYGVYPCSVPQEDPVTHKWAYSVENMCKFDSYSQSFECLVRWYTMRDKYKIIIGSKNYYFVCNYLEGRFATGSGYGQKLIEIIEAYKLTRFDEPVTYYYVVAGSFKSKKYAGNRRSALAAACYPTPEIWSDGFTYRVVVGIFTDRKNAERLCEKLTEKKFGNYIETNMTGWKRM